MANQAQKLTTRQRKAIAALVSCKDQRAAAEAAGIGYRTINRYLADDYFLAELHKAEAEIIGAAVRSLITDMPKNIEVMREIRDKQHAPLSVRLRAAQLIDQSLLKWREALDIEERLLALEQAVNNGNR
jgi:hypothetical protein